MHSAREKNRRLTCCKWRCGEGFVEFSNNVQQKLVQKNTKVVQKCCSFDRLQIYFADNSLEMRNSANRWRFWILVADKIAQFRFWKSHLDLIFIYLDSTFLYFLAKLVIKREFQSSKPRLVYPFLRRFISFSGWSFLLLLQSLRFHTLFSLSLFLFFRVFPSFTRPLLSVLLRLVVLLYDAPSRESRKWYKLTRQKFSRDHRYHRSTIPTFANNLPPGGISLPVEKVSLFYKNIVNRISLALQAKGKEDNFLTTFEYYDSFFSFSSVFYDLLRNLFGILKSRKRSNLRTHKL